MCVPTHRSPCSRVASACPCSRWSPMTPRPAHCRRIAFSLSLAWLLTGSRAGFAAAQAIHEPPALPVTIALLPSSDGVEASGFQDTDAIDVLLIRNRSEEHTSELQSP